MKRNVVNIVIIVVIILIVLFLVNLCRNYSILNGIYDSNKNFKNSVKNYHIVKNYDLNMEITKTIKEDVYFNEGIYLVKTYMNEEIYNIGWCNTNTNESISVDKTLENSKESESNTDFYKERYYEKDLLLYENEKNSEITSQILMKNIFKPITIKDGCYVIEANNSIIYVDKETKLVKKYIQGDTTVTLSVEEGTVTADDIAKDRVYK